MISSNVRQSVSSASRMFNVILKREHPQASKCSLELAEPYTRLLIWVGIVHVIWKQLCHSMHFRWPNIWEFWSLHQQICASWRTTYVQGS